MRRSWIICTLLLMLLTTMGVQAQTREDDIPYVPFAVTGGRPDNYNYTIRDRLEDFSRLYTAINTAVPVINQITGEPWTAQIVLVMMGNSGAGRTMIGRISDPYTSWVTRRETRQIFDPMVCHMRIFDGWATNTLLETIVARELFHCWQMQNGSAQFEDFTERSKFYWLQGTAEWVAYRAFPAQFPQPVHSIFDPRMDITQSRLDAFYFWEFMAGANGLGSTERVITQMDLLRTTPESLPLEFTYTPVDLFHNWAMTLYNGTLPLPPAIDLSGATLPAGNSGNLTTSLQRFSADYKNLFGFAVEDGNIAYLTISGMDDAGYAASLQLASGVQRLSDGDPIEFCPADSGNMIILSRAGGEAGSTPAITLEWGQNPSPNACKTEAPPPPDIAANCLVGEWVVDEYPVTQISGLYASVDTSNFIYSFGADGSLAAVYGITATAAGESMTIVADVSYSGSYDVEATEGGNYLVNDFSLTVEPGGNYTAIQGGTSTSLTQAYYNTSSDFSPWGPDGEIECDGDIMTWDTADGSGSFSLMRLG
jgi:hypothetical protein